MNSQRCSDKLVNTNFNPEVELKFLNDCMNLETAKSFFKNRILIPMQNGTKAALTKEKAAKFSFLVEQMSSKDQVVRFAYNIALSGMGMGTGFKRI